MCTDGYKRNTIAPNSDRVPNKMKVIHIATTDGGGAGIGLLNLHHALLANSIDSRILVAEKTSNENSIVQMMPNYNLFHWSKNKSLRKAQKILRRRGKLKTLVEYYNTIIDKASAKSNGAFFTSPFSIYDITQHPYYQSADIVHLHWISNFVDIPSFFIHNNKPIIWTLRDENPGLGGFHYRTDKEKFGADFYELENSFLLLKKKILENYENISLVALSDIMIDFCRGIDYLKSKKITKIYNPIDWTKYSIIEKQLAKKALGINLNSIVVSFVSVSINDKRKGLSGLVSALDQMDIKKELLCVGHNDGNIRRDYMRCFGSVEDSQLMSLIYSASDVFVSLSRQESFGKTIVEALLCGTPVVTTRVGIAPEIIDDSNGILLIEVDDDSISSAINTVVTKKYDYNKIRNRIKDTFDPNSIAKQHINLYNSILNKNYI